MKSTSEGGPSIVTDGLVLHLDAANPKSYPGSGTVWKDLSGNGNDGTLVNGPTFDSGNNGSIVFDGINDYIGLPNLKLRYPYYMEIVVKSKIETFDNMGITITDPSQNNRSIALQAVSTLNEARVTYYEGSFTKTTTYYEPGSIVTVSANLESSNFILYTNGKYKNDLIGDKEEIWDDDTTSVNIGKLNRPNTVYYPGTIYSLKIYNKALTAQEVLQNYNATKSRFNL